MSERVTFDARGIGDLLWQTIRDPRAVARVILAQNLPAQGLWMALALVTILSVLLVAGVQSLMPPPPEALAAQTVITPLTYGLILGGSLLVTVFALHWTGRALGGAGRFHDALALVTWLQLLLIVMQLAQAVLLLALPVVGGLVAIASLVVAIWVLVNFVRELHGFSGTGRAALTLVLAFLAMGIAISLILILMGVDAGAGGALT